VPLNKFARTPSLPESPASRIPDRETTPNQASRPSRLVDKESTNATPLRLNPTTKVTRL
jgi:hypothetical protein